MTASAGSREAVDAAWARFCAEVERFSLVLADAADAMGTTGDREWEPTRWWRAVYESGGRVWCESGSEAEVRERARPGDRIEQLWREVPRKEWRAAE